MKILEINTYCGTGSTGRIAVEIAEYAAQQGAETIIAFGTGSVPPEAETYALRVGGVWDRKWHGLIRKLFDAEGYGSLHATRRLIDFLRLYQPDVIHLHNLHGCYVNHRRLFAYLRTAHIPVIWTLHDCWAFTGHCAYFDYVGCEKWKSQCEHCPQLRSYPTCIGFDGSARNFQRRGNLFTSLSNLTLVTPCAWLRGLLQESCLKTIPSRVIYNGVNRSTFRPIASHLREKYAIEAPYVALAVASEWEERKGLRYLLPLANALGNGFQLVVLGLTEPQIADLPKNILGIAKTANTRELAQWYTTADCLVNPTMEDNMPLVNLEALACGTPVSTFATGGCPEAVDETCGIVVPKGDVAALADAVRSLCQQKPAMQAACLARAEQFDSLRTSQNYWALYQEVCK